MSTTATRLFQFDHAAHCYGFAGDDAKWTSATTLVAMFHDKFDAVSASISCCKNPRSKWFGMDPQEIRGHWEAKAQFSRDLGHWYHAMKERELLAQPFVAMRGQQIPVVAPLSVEGIKTARDQVLEPGLYVEHMLYDEGQMVCGIEDIVAVTDRHIDMYDHKTSFTIERQAFRDKRMFAPVNDIPDASYWHNALQMNIYMYMALQHNPGKLMGEMVLRHVTFEETEGPLGERIIEGDFTDGFKVKAVQSHAVPDLQDQVRRMLASGRHRGEAYLSKEGGAP